MKALYIEGLAIHDDPESCVHARKDMGEALTGACAGWVLSREITKFGVPTLLWKSEGNIINTAMQGVDGPRAVGDPTHAQNLSAREPGDPMVIHLVIHLVIRLANAGWIAQARLRP